MVNLSCGRNPWKRASIEDSTFRAYLKNPRFLSSILPLSPELDAILRRIFECDPRRRISIPELRDLIVRCPRFTSRTASAPPTPPPELNGAKCLMLETLQDHPNPFYHCPNNTPYTPSPSPPLHALAAQYSRLSLSSDGSMLSDDGSLFSMKSSCSGSSCGTSADVALTSKPTYVPTGPANNFYGNFFPLDPVAKQSLPQPLGQSVQVC